VFDANAFLKPYSAELDLMSQPSSVPETAATALSTDGLTEAAAGEGLPGGALNAENPGNVTGAASAAQTMAEALRTQGHDHDHELEQELQAHVTESAKAALEHSDPEDNPRDFAAQAKPSFLRKPARRPKRPNMLTRAVFVVLGVGLGVVFLLQFILYERDKLAATGLGMRSFLSTLCTALDCKISPVRQIESVVIDSSAFVHVRSDVYQLSFTLKNTAPIDIATPALELTLTDLQDQAVIRRVIMPIDYGTTASTQMAAGAEMSMSLPMAVKATDRAEKYSGYRVVIFYP
jgi:hypothetical protein